MNIKMTFLDVYAVSFQAEGNEIGLQVIYPSRNYLPRQFDSFIDYFVAYISQQIEMYRYIFYFE